MQAVSDAGVTQDYAHGVAEICDRKVGCLAQSLLITAFNEDRLTPCAARTIDIPPSVSDQVTGAKINIQLGCCSQHHARPRLATIARLAVPLASVETSLDAIQPRKR